MKNKNLLYIILILLGCSKKKEIPQIKVNTNKHILLTNEISIANAKSYGYKSFIIDSKKAPILCAAKHSISYALQDKLNEKNHLQTLKISNEEVNNELNYWKAFVNNGMPFKDTIRATRLINDKNNNHDIVLFNIDNKPKDIRSYKPRFTRLSKKDELKIITCKSNAAELCIEKTIKCEYIKFLEKDNKYILEVDFREDFDGYNTGGSPIIDGNGMVVGMVTGTYSNPDYNRLVIEPLKKVEKYL